MQQTRQPVGISERRTTQNRRWQQLTSNHNQNHIKFSKLLELWRSGSHSLKLSARSSRETGSTHGSDPGIQACVSVPQAHKETTIPNFTINAETDYLKGHIIGIPTNMLVDMGAAATILSKELWDMTKTSGAQLESSAGRKLVGEQGIPFAHVQIELMDEYFPQGQ